MSLDNGFIDIKPFDINYTLVVGWYMVFRMTLINADLNLLALNYLSVWQCDRNILFYFCEQPYMIGSIVRYLRISWLDFGLPDIPYKNKPFDISLDISLILNETIFSLFPCHKLDLAKFNQYQRTNTSYIAKLLLLPQTTWN